MLRKIKIRMLSKADIVKGQGVSSAYHEQVNLVKHSDKLDIVVNKRFKDADIIHHHTIEPGNYFKMFNKRYIHVGYVHVLAEKLEGSIKLNKFIYAIFKKYTHAFYRKADFLVIVNPDTKDMLMSYGISEDVIHYIPNYVDGDVFYDIADKRNEFKNKIGIEDDQFTVLAVGQVLLGKGIRDFMEVASLNPDITFVWAGGFSFGPLSDGYKELKSYVENPPINVKFIGIIDRDDMNEIYNAADVLFMPSYNEMFPMTILEAVNTSTPIVVRDLDLYEDILFDKYRKCSGIEDFNDEIRKLKDNPEYFSESKQRSIELSDFYSKDYVLKLWEDFYYNCIKEGEK